jgi:hypothetical protein
VLLWDSLAFASNADPKLNAVQSEDMPGRVARTFQALGKTNLAQVTGNHGAIKF